MGVQRKRAIFGVSILVLGIAIYGSFQVHPVSYMVDDLPQGDIVKEDVVWFENNFTGVMPLEIVIDTKENNGHWITYGQFFITAAITNCFKFGLTTKTEDIDFPLPLWININSSASAFL